MTDERAPPGADDTGGTIDVPRAHLTLLFEAANLLDSVACGVVDVEDLDDEMVALGLLVCGVEEAADGSGEVDDVFAERSPAFAQALIGTAMLLGVDPPIEEDDAAAAAA